MTAPLWTLDDFLEATGGEVRGDPSNEITGISIDSRTLQEGEAFVAIIGDRFDGHDFVDKAMENGAALALVGEDRIDDLPADGRYVVVPDPLAALRFLGVAARQRTDARIIAVTGSVGKTGTKEALRTCLEACGKTHASVASFNNHWGVPLTLARMPADTEYGVFEIGMNHAGEITPLVQMVRPHVVVITAIEPVHLEFFGSLEKITQAKAEIFSGLEPEGFAVLPRDSSQFDLLSFLATASNVRNIRTFGTNELADNYLIDSTITETSSLARAMLFGTDISYMIGAPGDHYVKNSLAVMTAVVLVGGDLELAADTLANVHAPKGRGETTELHLSDGTAQLIDESYNANPASMRAAFSVAGAAETRGDGRRIAVIGDMRELGADADALHAELAEPLTVAGFDLVYCVGTHMRALWEKLPEDIKATCVEKADELIDVLPDEVRAGDVIMVKGSLGTGMGPLVSTLKKAYPLVEEERSED
ncbi:MAG: UDP-N-acetylmuramoylalanyl-D-glutamyl-2,6-diaminopimelate--D-alanyl-D-alanine ligase [Rhodobacteraceae bacterium]|nr:UDP-N-acetylmuramoylalanyl-D-glutamyl-2,6-diaminopimelate--D-alanyl-D-alanine ligase [Paracoccaceae bacterium]